MEVELGFVAVGVEVWVRWKEGVGFRLGVE